MVVDLKAPTKRLRPPSEFHPDTPVLVSPRHPQQNFPDRNPRALPTARVMEHAETSRTLKTRREATNKIGHAASQLITPGCRDPKQTVRRKDNNLQRSHVEMLKLKC